MFGGSRGTSCFQSDLRGFRRDVRVFVGFMVFKGDLRESRMSLRVFIGI